MDATRLNIHTFNITDIKINFDAKVSPNKISPYKPRRLKMGVNVLFYSFFNLGDRWVWVVKATPRLLYPRERPGTNSIGDWMGPSACQDEYGKSRPHRDSIPVPSSP
jgi:hypothetical protein